MVDAKDGELIFVREEASCEITKEVSEVYSPMDNTGKLVAASPMRQAEVKKTVMLSRTPKNRTASEAEMLKWLAAQPNQMAKAGETPFWIRKWLALAKNGTVDYSYDADRSILVRIKSNEVTESGIGSKSEPKCISLSGSPFDNKLHKSVHHQVKPIVANQGRGAEIKWKHLSFRSNHEVAIASELDIIGVMFFPNAAVRLTENGKRVTKEVDFLVCKDGCWGILEVDGSQHRESRAEDMMRDDAFTDAGIWFIRRYPASVCSSEPAWVAQDFISRLDTYYSRLK